MLIIKQNGRSILLPELDPAEEVYWQERAKKLLPGHQVTIKRRLPYLGEIAHYDIAAWTLIVSPYLAAKPFDAMLEVEELLDKVDPPQLVEKRKQ